VEKGITRSGAGTRRGGITARERNILRRDEVELGACEIEAVRPLALGAEC